MAKVVIEWSTAIQQAKENEVKRQQEKEYYLQEFYDNSFDMLDARDLNFFAEMTGIEANELRRMHPQSKTLEMYVNSFEGDDTDNVISFF